MRYTLGAFVGCVLFLCNCALAQEPGYHLLTKDGEAVELAEDAQVSASAAAAGDVCVLNNWIPNTITKSQQLARSNDGRGPKESRDKKAKILQEQLWKTLQPLAGRKLRYTLTVTDVIKRDDGSYIVVGTIPFDNPPVLTDSQQQELRLVDTRHRSAYNSAIQLAESTYYSTPYRKSNRARADDIKKQWDDEIEQIMAPIRNAVPAQTLYVRVRKSGMDRLAPGQTFKGSGWVHRAAMFVCADKDEVAIKKTPDAAIPDDLSRAYIAFEFEVTQVQ